MSFSTASRPTRPARSAGSTDCADPADCADRSRWAGLRHPAARRALTIGTAALAGLVVWAGAHLVAGIDLVVGSGPDARTISPSAVTGTVLVAGLAAVVLAVVLGQNLASARRPWTIVALIVLVLSLAGPLGAASLGAGVALAALHLVVGGILIVGISSTLARKTPEA